MSSPVSLNILEIFLHEVYTDCLKLVAALQVCEGSSVIGGILAGKPSSDHSVISASLGILVMEGHT